ncbi:FecR domain-containing protein [Desulfuribacillus alkaliarsenatis]|uniref:FecR protein domain-containing protein n=1 Tax=Desulfuribacillus alkaliarsenatis TaxID=766136 RepID=A0A1E5G1S6_9FIRM|nr:FecR domain-containing protein [Desulfuribacillus alkaliarsenatis]OEF96860.1 hypothetical protein BHF68_07310 [Desulfuribacillus alkaliarsenatis]
MRILNSTQIRKRKGLRLLGTIILCLSLLLPIGGITEASVTNARVISIDGDVQVMRGGGDKPFSAFVNMRLMEGDRIITGRGASARVEIDNERTITLSENTRIYLSELRGVSDTQQSSIALQAGGVASSVKSAVTSSSRFEIRTPTAVMGVRGTEFFTSYRDGEVDVRVVTGSVNVAASLSGGTPTPPARPPVVALPPVLNPEIAGGDVISPPVAPPRPIRPPAPPPPHPEPGAPDGTGMPERTVSFVVEAMQQVRFTEHTPPEQLLAPPEPFDLVGLDVIFIDRVAEIATETPEVIPEGIRQVIPEARQQAEERAQQQAQRQDIAPDELAELLRTREQQAELLNQRMVAPRSPSTVAPPPPPAPPSPTPAPTPDSDPGDSGGGGGEITQPTQPSASINIISVEPSTGIIPGIETTFSVQLSYQFSGINQGIVYLGFNDVEEDSYRLVSDQIVTSNSGTITLTGDAIVRNWGETPFKAYANISEYPHPDTWSPLWDATYDLHVSQIVTGFHTRINQQFILPDVSFPIIISDAYLDGNILDDSYEVEIFSNNDEVVFSDYVEFIDGQATVDVTLTSIGEHQLTVYIIALDMTEPTELNINVNGFSSLFAGGNGEVEDPYRIANPYQLNMMRYGLDKHYRLVDDIDLIDFGEEYDDGRGWVPIGDSVEQFTGTLDGNTFTISNLFINRPVTDFVGLFGVVGINGHLNSVALNDLVVTGDSYVGGIAGKSKGSINNSYASGYVVGSNFNTGGLVGKNYGGSIGNSYSAGSVIGHQMVGGLVGYNEARYEPQMVYASIAYSYSTSEVTGYRWVGGLTGSINYASITDSFALNPSLTKTSGNWDFGRITGLIGHDSDLANNYARYDMVEPFTDAFENKTPIGKDGGNLLSWSMVNGELIPHPSINTTSTIYDVDVVIEIEIHVRFGTFSEEATTTSSWVVDTTESSLALYSVTKNSDTNVTLSFNGTISTGETITIQALAQAFSGEFDSNELEIVVVEVPEVPLNLDGVGIDIINDVITGTTSNMEYSFDSTTGLDGTWSDCTDGETNVTFSHGLVFVRQKDNHSNFRHLTTIAQPAGPPTIGSTNQTSIVVNDGSIIGVDDTMEYKLQADSTWTVVPAEAIEVSGLVPGNYEVRVAATELVLPSQVAVVTIASPTTDLFGPINLTGGAEGINAYITITSLSGGTLTITFNESGTHGDLQQVSMVNEGTEELSVRTESNLLIIDLGGVPRTTEAIVAAIDGMQTQFTAVVENNSEGASWIPFPQ